jgi:hypothetical protein
LGKVAEGFLKITLCIFLANHNPHFRSFPFNEEFIDHQFNHERSNREGIRSGGSNQFKFISRSEILSADLVTIHNGDWLFGEEDLGINNSVDDDSGR